MSQKLVGVLTGLITGYLLGMIIGFTLFDPDQDVWALLGFVLSLVGMGVGLTPLFRRNNAVILMALIGFYFGTLIGTVFFGNIAQDDLLEVLQRQIL